MPRVAEEHINEWDVMFIARNNAPEIIRDVDMFCEMIENESRPAVWRWQKARELHFYLKQHAKELRAAVKAASSLIDKLEHQMDANS